MGKKVKKNVMGFLFGQVIDMKRLHFEMILSFVIFGR